MQEQTVRELEDTLTHQFQKALPETITNTEKIRTIVTQQIQDIKDSGKLFELSDEEITLLVDYRLWKQSTAVVSGVFHWKIKK